MVNNQMNRRYSFLLAMSAKKKLFTKELVRADKFFRLLNKFLTPSPMAKKLTTPIFLKLRLTKRAYISVRARERLHKVCKPTAATR